jgi:long-subunit fatty acid transport protein
MKRISFLLLLTLFFSKAQAQKSAENKLGAWYMYNGTHKLSDKYSIQTMAHFRYFEVTSQFQQEIYRLGVNYAFNKKTNFTIGVSYASGDLAYDIPSIHLYEWRLYEDLNVTSNWQKFKARHRFRLEHRFTHRDFIDETINWFRYDLNLNYPLSKNWSVYAFNEIFLNFKGNVIGQNWTGAGFIHKIDKNLKFKIGYFQIKQDTNTLKRIRLGVLLNTDFF